MFCKYFFPVSGLSFHSLNGVFWKEFYFDEIQFINLLFYVS